MHNLLSALMRSFYSSVVILAVGLALPNGATAQETAATTPPELREFRLEPKPEEKPAEPAPIGPPSPEVAPKATPAPAAVPSPVESNPAAAPTDLNLVSVAKSPSKPDVKVEASLPKVEEKGADEQIALPLEDAEAPEIGGDITGIAPTEAADVEGNRSWKGYGAALPFWALIGIGILPVALIGLWLLRRRRRRPEQFAEEFGENFGTALSANNQEMPIKEAEPVVPSQPRLLASFVAESAQLSIANLTITGRLTLHNTSAGPLRTLTVRTTMISASDGQREIIHQFHADASRGHAEIIGDIRAGEEVSLALEIQQPRLEMNEFDWRERRFLAPIVLINLSGRGPQGMETCELSCLIGRDAVAETHRMKPFHTDRGPQRFEGLALHLV